MIEVSYEYLFFPSKIFDNKLVDFQTRQTIVIYIFLFSLDFNGRYRLDHFHMVVIYVIDNGKGKQEYQAAWQVNNATYNQWKKAILQLQARYPKSELA